MARDRKERQYNALTHGIFATLILSGDVMGEHEKDYHQLRSTFGAAIKPTNAVEEMLVEKLAFLYLRLSRVYRADLDVSPLLFKKIAEAVKDRDVAVETIVIDDPEQVVIARRRPAPDLLMRYEVSIERQIARTLEQLVLVKHLIK